MSKNEQQLDCPFCDKEGHLYLNVAKQVFYCFKCGAKGVASQLKRYGYSSISGTDILNRDVSYRLTTGLEDPPRYEKLTTSSREYLTQRGVHVSVLQAIENTVFETDTGLLFFYPDEEYWQIRRWSQFAPPRWKNPSVAPRSPAQGVVYHLSTQYGSRNIAIVEGIIDALRVAPFANVAAVLSSRVHEAQCIRLAEHGYESATYIPDRDVDSSKQLAALSILGQWFKNVTVFNCEADDPGDAYDSRLSALTP